MRKHVNNSIFQVCSQIVQRFEIFCHFFDKTHSLFHVFHYHVLAEIKKCSFSDIGVHNRSASVRNGFNSYFEGLLQNIPRYPGNTRVKVLESVDTILDNPEIKSLLGRNWSAAYIVDPWLLNSVRKHARRREKLWKSFFVFQHMLTCTDTCQRERADDGKQFDKEWKTSINNAKHTEFGCPALHKVLEYPVSPHNATGT